jgi:hypothetical protein
MTLSKDVDVWRKCRPGLENLEGTSSRGPYCLSIVIQQGEH